MIYRYIKNREKANQQKIKPEILSIEDKVIWMSPVPGGKSKINTSKQKEITIERYNYSMTIEILQSNKKYKHPQQKDWQDFFIKNSHLKINLNSNQRRKPRSPHSVQEISCVMRREANGPIF